MKTGIGHEGPSTTTHGVSWPISLPWPCIVRGSRRATVVLASWGVGVGVGLLGPPLLLSLGLLAGVDGTLTNLGFDAERVLLIDRMVCTLLGAGLGAGLCGRRVAGAAGALLFYLFGYMLSFSLSAAHPGLSPTGQHQVVIVGTYASILLTLGSLGVLSAGIGAMLGGATRELALALARPVWAAWPRHAQRTNPSAAARALARPLLALAAAMSVIAILMLGASGSANVLTYGPTTGMYAPVGALPAPRPTGPRASSASGNAVPLALARGTVERGMYTSSSLGGLIRPYYIYLPPSYAVDTTRRYPTVYLLHGSPGNPRDWIIPGQAPLTEDSLVAAGKMREAILVSADGRGPVYRFSEWANSADGRQRMEDAIAMDLVTYIDRHYRTLPDAADRVIAGLSEGGFGAINIALHHPNVFGAAVSEGGYFTAQGIVFGSGPQNVAARAYNSPALYIRTPAGQQAASRLRFVIGDGTGDGRYYQGAIAFANALRQMHANVTLIVVGGGHSWHNWAGIFVRAIQDVEGPSPPPHPSIVPPHQPPHQKA